MSKQQIVALASKVLGYGVVAGATFVKVPQITKIYQNRSVKGLSRSMFESELLGYTLVLFYGIHRKLALNAYGEYYALLLQTLVLILLHYRFEPPPPVRTALLVGPYLAIIAGFVTGSFTDEAMEHVQSLANLVFWSARVPQIWANFRARSTGELSLATFTLNTAGAAVRVLTSVQEGGGRSMVAGAVVGLLLNSIITAQILAYPAAGGGGKGKGGKAAARPRARKTD